MSAKRLDGRSDRRIVGWKFTPSGYSVGQLKHVWLWSVYVWRLETREGECAFRSQPWDYNGKKLKHNSWNTQWTAMAFFWNACLPDYLCNEIEQNRNGISSYFLDAKRIQFVECDSWLTWLSFSAPIVHGGESRFWFWSDGNWA